MAAAAVTTRWSAPAMLLGVCVCALTAAASAPSGAPAAASDLTRAVAAPIPLPARFDPSLITAGGDGTMWIASGVVYPKPGALLVGRGRVLKQLRSGGAIHGMVTSADGSLWFASDSSTAVGRVTVAGAVERFPTGLRLDQYDWIGAVALGSDGNLWFDAAQGRMVELGRSGKVLHVYRPLGEDGRLLAADAEGRVWVRTVSARPTRVALLVDGSVRWQTRLPKSAYVPSVVALAPDGSLWMPATPTFARISPGGRATLVRTSPDYAFAGTVRGMAFDDAGTLWFATSEPSAIGSLKPDGSVTMYPQLVEPAALAIGSDGELWFAGAAAGRSLVVHAVPPPSAACLVPDLYGMRLAEAEAKLSSDTACRLGTVRGDTSGIVWGQSPLPETTLPGRSRVTLLLGRGRAGLPGTWRGSVTTDQCTSNGGTQPSGEFRTETLRITRATGSRLTATFGRTRFRLVRHRRGSYDFASVAAGQALSLRGDWPSISIVLVDHDYGGCSSVETYGDLQRTADP